MRSLRVALVTETFYPAVDAATTSLRATLDRLVDLGHTVLVVAPGPGLADHRGARVHRVSTLDGVGAQVRGALEAFGPDVVHVSSPGRLGRKALKHARAAGVPSLVVEHSPLLDTSPDYWRRKVVRRADRVVVTSTWMRERLLELDVDAPVWTPGVDPVAFTPALRDDWLHRTWSRHRSAQGPGVVVGYVGALHRRRGVRHLDVLAGLPGVRPVVVGEGPERAWLEARLPGSTFLGALQTGDLSVALPSLDVLVHPGEHQTCAHVLREAGASGVPVVAARAGGAVEVVRHGETGLLHHPGSRHDLARRVSRLVADPGRARLGERAREVLAGRTWTAAVDELLEDHLAPLAARRHDASAPGRR